MDSDSANTIKVWAKKIFSFRLYKDWIVSNDRVQSLRSFMPDIHIKPPLYSNMVLRLGYEFMLYSV